MEERGRTASITREVFNQLPTLSSTASAWSCSFPVVLQVVASDLVNYLIGQKRQIATLADLEVAVDKVLATAQAYSHYL